MKNIPLHDVRPITNVKDMINSSVEIYGDKAAFLVKNKSDNNNYSPITYKQLKHDMDAMGTALLNLGLKDKRVAIISENRYEWAISYLAVLNGTGIVVPLDKELPQNEIENLVKRSKVNVIIFSDSIYPQIQEMAKGNISVEYYINMDGIEDNNGILAFNKLIMEGKELLGKGDTSFTNADIDVKAMNILLFTSATTDKSKAVMLSHENLVTNLMSMSSMICINPTDIFLSVLPIHHTYECTCGFLCPLYRGAAIAYCEGLRHIPKNLQESKATVMLAVPLIFEAIFRRIWDQAKKTGSDKKLKTGIKISNLLRKFGIDITRKLFAPVYSNLGGSVRLFISGAAPIDANVSKGFRDLGLLFLQGYGLTECSPIAALNRDVDFKDNAAGLPLPGLELKIDAPNDEGVGEIIVKGPNVMLGYYQDTESTSKFLIDGWFYTGDLGYIDNDGFVHITGRKKHVIVTKNGKNIYPEEIEILLNRSPYIKESLVYGKSDEVYGDVVVSASIVPDIDRIQEIFKDQSPSDEEIYNLIKKEVKEVNKKLVIYKYIRDFNLRENEFAKTTTKKIKRYMERVD
ncbi:MAG TPA: AMP-binding protein [Clostridiales bacterium]|nr:AMP-binding protein [Clostridiales bacterium]